MEAKVHYPHLHLIEWPFYIGWDKCVYPIMANRTQLNDGFKGDVDALSNAVTLTIIHPSADLQKVKESLELTAKDIELRLKRERWGLSEGRMIDYKRSMNEKGGLAT